MKITNNLVKQLIKEVIADRIKMIDEAGDSKLKNFGLDEFIEQFIDGLDNPIIMSMFYRMLDTNSFVKFGQEIYSFTDKEKEKLEKIKPLLDDLVNTVSKIKNIQKGG